MGLAALTARDFDNNTAQSNHGYFRLTVVNKPRLLCSSFRPHRPCVPYIYSLFPRKENVQDHPHAGPHQTKLEACLPHCPRLWLTVVLGFREWICFVQVEVTEDTEQREWRASPSTTCFLQEDLSVCSRRATKALR